jgi:ferredoxin-type protein NapH
MNLQSNAGLQPVSNPTSFKTFLLALPMLLFSAMLISGGSIPKQPLELISFIATYLFLNSSFILMIHRGKTDRYRAVVFVTYAVCFVISFIANLIEARGSMMYTHENMLTGNIPFCHIVTPMVLIPAALTRTIIFPGSMLKGYASIASMLVLVFGFLIALGRGFCSWGCFYGGLEDGFSRVAKKARLKLDGSKWRLFPFAVLLVIVLTSALTMFPTYCDWVCPFKAVTEFEKITSITVLVKTFIFVTLFIGLVILLPILTKKRTQCSFLCPFGAFASLANKVAPFTIRIDHNKCINCKLCAEACPNFSLDAGRIKLGKPHLTCMKCGKCVDICPRQAISFRIKGTAGRNPLLAKMFFLYPAFILLATMGGGTIRDALYRIMLLVTTGSILK